MKKFNAARKNLSCLLVLIFIFILCSAAFAATTVTEVAGKAEILKASAKDWEPAKVGDPLAAGDKVRVDGKGQAIVQSEGGKVKVSVQGNTNVSYQGNDAGTEKFGLEKGRVWVNVVPGNAVTTASPIQTASVRGTEYSHAFDTYSGTGVVMVTVGTVEVTNNATGEVQTLGAGDKATATGGPSEKEKEAAATSGSQGSTGGGEGGGGG